jgi:hypothetical protein
MPSLKYTILNYSIIHTVACAVLIFRFLFHELLKQGYKIVYALKVARRGLYSTAALSIADCALAPNDVVPSFISRGATTPSGAGALY